MKKYYSTILLALCLISCNKLDEVVYSSLTDDNAFSTAENAQAAVNSIYAPLHSLYREPMFYINDIAADTGFKNGNCFEVMNDNSIYNDNRTLVAWNHLFQIASRANIVIDRVPEMSDNLFRDGLSKKQMLGEAYFMRAFAYYNLSDVFYRVPLVTDSKVSPTDKLPLASLEDIEYCIENDLFNAKDYLPKSYASKDDAQRPTWAAACGYLARLYMRQAGRARQNGDPAEQDYWKYALTEIDNVLSLEGSLYSLQANVWDVFDPSREECLYNNELIFAIKASGKIVSGSWDLGLQFTSWEYDMGWGNMYQPLEMTWKFDPEDERFSVLQVVEYEDVYNPDKTFYKAPENISQSGSVPNNHTYGGKTYTEVVEMSETFTQKYKFLNTWKYIYETPNNLPLLRLSDVILCKAEVLNELNGPCEEALSLINRIRERAFQNTDHNLTLSDYPDKAALRNAICDERMYELNLECLRRPDLIRMGLWKDRMQEYVTTIAKKYAWKEQNESRESGYYDGAWAAYPSADSFTDKDLRMYMPIPYREVTMNPELAEARDYVQ
ncbi:MAG: RagB/SusD family nutrient uptake outer membrane protein [Candidatus Cryptobacteroides sp.]